MISTWDSIILLVEKNVAVEPVNIASPVPVIDPVISIPPANTICDEPNTAEPCAYRDAVNASVNVLPVIGLNKSDTFHIVVVPYPPERGHNQEMQIRCQLYEIDVLLA